MVSPTAPWNGEFRVPSFWRWMKPKPKGPNLLFLELGLPSPPCPWQWARCPWWEISTLGRDSQWTRGVTRLVCEEHGVPVLNVFDRLSISPRTPKIAAFGGRGGRWLYYQYVTYRWVCIRCEEQAGGEEDDGEEHERRGSHSLPLTGWRGRWRRPRRKMGTKVARKLC